MWFPPSHLRTEGCQLVNSEQLSPWMIQEGHAEVQPKDGWLVAGLWSAQRSHYYNKIYTQKYVCLKSSVDIHFQSSFCLHPSVMFVSMQMSESHPGGLRLFFCDLWSFRTHCHNLLQPKSWTPIPGFGPPAYPIFRPRGAALRGRYCYELIHWLIDTCIYPPYSGPIYARIPLSSAIGSIPVVTLSHMSCHTRPITAHSHPPGLIWPFVGTCNHPPNILPLHP